MPATVTVTDIIAGEADVSVGTAGSETDLGSTMDGVSVREEVEWLDVKVDQSIGIVAKIVVSRRVYVTFSVAEATLEHWRVAWNLASSKLVTSTLTIDESENGSQSLVIVGPGPGTGATSNIRTATFPKAVAMGSSEHSYKVDAVTVMPMEFEILSTPTDSGRFGHVSDVST